MRPGSKRPRRLWSAPMRTRGIWLAKTIGAARAEPGVSPTPEPFLSGEAAMEACDKHFTCGHELVTLYEGRVRTTEHYFSLEPAKIIQQFCRQSGRMKADCSVFNFGVTSADRVAFTQWLKDNPTTEQRWIKLARDFSPGLFGQAANYWVNAYEKPASE